MNKMELQNWLNLTDEQYSEYQNSNRYFEKHWDLYTHIVSSTIHSMSLIESLLDIFILHFKIELQNKSNFDSENISLRSKYLQFISLINEMNFDNDKITKKFKKLSKLIDYRNKLAHSFLDNNYLDYKKLGKINKVNLRYNNYKSYGNKIHSISLNEHKEKLTLFNNVYWDLKMFLIQTIDNTELLDDKNGIILKNYNQKI